MADIDPSQYLPLLEAASQETGIPVGLLYAQMVQESGGNPNAVSPAGAQGLMQFMPATAKAVGVTNPFDPEQSIRGGAKLMKQLMDKYGNEELALAAYNAGEGNVDKYKGIPPFKETQNYVQSIKGAYATNPTPKAKVNFNVSLDAAKSRYEGTSTPTEGQDNATNAVANPFNPSLKDVKDYYESGNDVAPQGDAGIPEKEAAPDGTIPSPIPLVPGAKLEVTPEQRKSILAAKYAAQPGIQDILAGTLSAAKGRADWGGIGFAERQLGKVPGLTKLSEYLNNAIMPGPDKTFEERAQEVQGKTNEAVAAHPYLYGIGAGSTLFDPTSASSLAGKAFTGVAGKGTSVLGKILKGAGRAGTEGAALETVANENATPSSVALSGVFGAGVGTLLHTVAQTPAAFAAFAERYPNAAKSILRWVPFRSDKVQRLSDAAAENYNKEFDKYATDLEKFDSDTAAFEDRIKQVKNATLQNIEELGKPKEEVGRLLQESISGAKTKLGDEYSAAMEPILKQTAKAPVDTTSTVAYIDKVLDENKLLAPKLRDLKKIKEFLVKEPTLESLEQARKFAQDAADFAKANNASPLERIYRGLYTEELAPKLIETIDNAAPDAGAIVKGAKAKYASGSEGLKSVKKLLNATPESTTNLSKMTGSQISKTIDKFPELKDSIADTIRYNFSNVKTANRFDTIFDHYGEKTLEKVLGRGELEYLKSLRENFDVTRLAKEMGTGAKKPIKPVRNPGKSFFEQEQLNKEKKFLKKTSDKVDPYGAGLAKIMNMLSTQSRK